MTTARSSTVATLMTTMAGLAIVVSGCTATVGGPSGSPVATASTGTSGSPAPTATGADSSPGASGSVPAPTDLPTPTPGTTATPAPTPRPSSAPPADTVTTAKQAAGLVLASDDRFRAIEPYDPSLIGQAAWYAARPKGDGFEVVVRIGWGDCQAGCIDEHRWTFEVSRQGDVRLVGESGPPVPAGVGVSGRVVAGPTCPVERVPPDPACAPRAVAGAVLVVRNDSGDEVARVTSAANGDFAILLPAGHYVLEPQPVAGLLGTASPIAFTILPGGPAVTLDVEYDTGIR